MGFIWDGPSILLSATMKNSKERGDRSLVGYQGSNIVLKSMVKPPISYIREVWGSIWMVEN